MIQNVKRNKDECAQLMENIHPVLYAIINLHLRAETVESLSPEMLDNIGKFMETLHKIYTFLEGQQDRNRIKYLFRNNEVQKLFRDCHAGLDQAVEVFEKIAQLMHKEFFELIQTLSDSSTNSNRSSVDEHNRYSQLIRNQVYQGGNESKNRIFYGHELEVENIMKMLSQDSPRIAILGGGGMGKTSLAKVILHYPQTLEKFQHKFFVSAESATTSIELAALIGLHVGLNPGTDLTKPVVQYLSCKPSCLLILDNLETAWEPMQSRGGIEEFLSLLTEVKHLALLITMRGAERPGKVHWTHPFLSPLQPLWQTERTSLLTLGYDRKSNMDVSISLSLSSPRVTSESKGLLSLLSTLPDGLSHGELVQYKLPIHNILSCKTALLATSLAYQDSNRRLRSLMPMREHVQKFLPPSLALVQCVRKRFYALLELYQKYNGEQLGPVINQITLNLANFHQVLQQGLYNHAPDLGITIHNISSLNSFYRLTGRGYTGLMDSILPILPGLDNPQLQLHFITKVLKSYAHYPSLDREQFITQAPNMIEHINNPLLGCRFYHAAGIYFRLRRSDIHQAMQFYNTALDLSRLCQDTNEQYNVLLSIAQLKYRTGDYYTAQAHIAEALQLSKSAPNLIVYTEAESFLAMAIQQGEIHVLKSEYAQARSIHSQIVATVSPDLNAYTHAMSLLNIVHIDIICGDVMDVYHKLNQAKQIFNMFAGQQKLYTVTQLRLILNSERKKLTWQRSDSGNVFIPPAGQTMRFNHSAWKDLPISQPGQVWNGNSDGQ
ncbi:hypothetical protein B0H14DRAFT_3172051 [Mycena olivaceomarginata]|nr:hypothetical protein B0H14DRAFT_3172051 [Mycena olivaceomarginata]